MKYSSFLQESRHCADLKKKKQQQYCILLFFNSTMLVNNEWVLVLEQIVCFDLNMETCINVTLV